MTIQANFSDSGLVIGQNDNNMTYLYGLSDFFSVMFQDTSTLNLLLEAESEVASEVYSRFLQFTSTLTLSGIQEATNSTIKLVLLSSTNLVPGQPNTYQLTDNIQSANYIANRAFLPTELLDQNVDFGIIQQADGTCWVQFAKPISSYAFPVRLLSDGVTEQYALWFVDAVVDEKLISNYYGNLIAISPENASAQFADFVYGLFYVYMHGPNLDTLSRGLNLVLGIPVARANETVLSIRQYLQTDQYLVICDQNQYVIPYGLQPTVNEGDSITVGQSLAQWVELQDYESNGDWWINLHIPEKLVPQIPAGQKDRYATAGSHYDYLMRNYLKTHTFLVKVNVSNFKNLQQYAQISDVIKRAKPCYTEAIYVWTISDSEVLNPQDPMAYRYDGTWDDSIHPDISRLNRANTDDPLSRGMRHFIRYNVDKSVTRIVGDDNYADSFTTDVGSDVIAGFVNPVSQFRTNTSAEQGWIRSILRRGHPCYYGYRNKIGFHRGAADPAVLDGTTVRLEDSFWNVDLTYKMVPLYTTTIDDISAKMQLVGFTKPPDYQWSFEIFSPRSYAQAINDLAVNYLPPAYDPAALLVNYGILMARSEANGYLGREFGPSSRETFLPTINQLMPGDYLLCIRITQTVVGVYWITTSTDQSIPPYFTVGETDPVLMTYNMPISRGGGLNGAPFYVMRGARMSNYNNLDASIDAVAINDYDGDAPTITSQPYTDKYNSSVPIDRSGASFIHAVESF